MIPKSGENRKFHDLERGETKAKGFVWQGKRVSKIKKLALLTLGFLLCYSEITFGVLPGTVLGC